MAQIFVSYSRTDSEFVKQLIEWLQIAFPRQKLWHDQNLTGGDDWWEEILKAIKASDVFIYILSKESIESRYCWAEFTEAYRLQKRIIPIQARDYTELGEGLGDIQIIDMRNGANDGKMLLKLTEAINKQLGLARRLRPRSTLVTRKPSKEQPTTRPLNAPDIYTPELSQPALEREAVRIARIGVTWQIVGVIVAIVAIVFGLIPWLSGQGQNSVTPSITLTQTPMLEIAFIVQTLDVQATFDQATLNVESTAAVRATEYAVGTRSVFDQTAIATLWTNTPTPNLTASIEAYRTHQAATITQVWIDSWTNTPTRTPTPTASLTPTQTPTRTPTLTPALTYTLTPLQALDNATNFSGGNTDWVAFETTFADGVSMMLVPKGCFEMGSTDFADAQPVERYCFDAPFWIDRTEVTQADFIRLNGFKANPNSFSGADRPVDNVTWFEARNFCALRGARLPTEAEWEFAARGVNAWAYPWGNEWNSNNAVWNRTPVQGMANVGSIPAGASWVGH